MPSMDITFEGVMVMICIAGSFFSGLERLCHVWPNSVPSLQHASPDHMRLTLGA